MNVGDPLWRLSGAATLLGVVGLFVGLAMSWHAFAFAAALVMSSGIVILNAVSRRDDDRAE